MKGQILVRRTNQKDSCGRDVAVLLGVVAFEGIDTYKDGYKYDLLDISMWNGKDFTELNEQMSPEDLLEENIWRIPK